MNVTQSSVSQFEVKRQTKNNNFLDETLVKRVCTHDCEVAFNELYRRHVRFLFQTAIRKTGFKPTAEDLVQETFVKFWMGRKKFDIQKNVRAYLTGILKNGIINYYNLKQNKPGFILEIENFPADNHTCDVLDFNTLNDCYEQSLLKLPQKCRTVFISSRKGFTIKEIASEMEISEKTVEAHISKALRILHIELKDYIV